MDDKMTRREALRGMFLAGMGLAFCGPMLCDAARAANRPGAPAGLPGPWKEAPAGTKIDTRTWSKMGETLGMLGLGCMRLPTLGGGGGGFGRNAPLDQEAVNAMVDYAIMNGRATLEAGQQMFETSLKNLHVDYIDFLLLHNLQNMRGFETRFKNNGLFDWLLEQKAKGRIRHIGFSFHGTNDDLPGLVDLYDWDFVQIQLNYVDWKEMSRGWGGSSGTTSAEYLYKYLESKGIPALVMEPVKGGQLANVDGNIAAVLKERHPDLTPAANALTFVGSLPGVMVTLSGMSNMEQLKENVSLFTGFKPFDQQEHDFMLTIADLLKSKGQIPCTACAYCMPCPAGVDIPGNFKIFNSASDALLSPDTGDKNVIEKRKAFLKAYKAQEEGVRADACIGCNACLRYRPITNNSSAPPRMSS